MFGKHKKQEKYDLFFEHACDNCFIKKFYETYYVHFKQGIFTVFLILRFSLKTISLSFQFHIQAFQ